MAYKVWTVKDFIKELKSVAKDMPKGMDTPVYSGDFECNCLHSMHELMIDNKHNAIFVGYEMHENIEEW